VTAAKATTSRTRKPAAEKAEPEAEFVTAEAAGETAPAEDTPLVWLYCDDEAAWAAARDQMHADTLNAYRRVLAVSADQEAALLESWLADPASLLLITENEPPQTYHPRFASSRETPPRHAGGQHPHERVAEAAAALADALEAEAASATGSEAADPVADAILGAVEPPAPAPRRPGEWVRLREGREDGGSLLPAENRPLPVGKWAEPSGGVE
jgi:hypothetical protein